MIIKNFEIETFGKFLFDLRLKGKESRMRTRFVKLLDEHLMLINTEREQMINEYAKKDENGKILTEEYEGKEAYILNDPEEYRNEVNKLMNEDFILEESAERMEMLTVVKEIVLECDLEFSGMDAMQFDRWCEIVEDINV